MTDLHMLSDEYYMNLALTEAKRAAENGEIPVGAIIVSQQTIIAKGHNQTELLQDVTAHAEMLAITSAAVHLGSKYLRDCTLYVTLEPCVMCAGAMRWAQLGRIVYGASDDKGGFMRYGKDLLHPKTTLEYGIHQEACRHLLTHFFEKRRMLQR